MPGGRGRGPVVIGLARLLRAILLIALSIKIIVYIHWRIHLSLNSFSLVVGNLATVRISRYDCKFGTLPLNLSNEALFFNLE
jgi:hypothetical protein